MAPRSIWKFIHGGRGEVVPIWRVFLGIGLLYSVFERRWQLPAWFLILLTFFAMPRYVMVPGGLLAGIAISNVVLPGMSAAVSNSEISKDLTKIVVVILICIFSIIGGGIFASMMPQIMDERSGEQLNKATATSSEEATILALGNTAEWVPYFTNRDILISPWGNEWTGSYTEQLRKLRGLSECQTSDCLEKQAGEYSYVVLPNNQRHRTLNKSLVADSDYKIVATTTHVRVFKPILNNNTN